MADFLIYGATGYTGSLVAREAARRGLQPILAGRHPENVAARAGELGLEHRAFALDSPGTADGIRGVRAVLNCAGPFSRTARPLADACLAARTHYLDITGEAAVLEAMAARDAEARSAGVVLLPGTGFDVVPSDCLAVHLKRRLPTATKLVLAFRSSGRMSRGTALTALERAADGGLVRKNGVLTRVPAAWKTRRFDFGDGPMKAMTIPWGDVATAHHSTGIPDIEVYLAAPWALRTGARLTRCLGWLLRAKPVRGLIERRIRSGPPGPTEAERAANSSDFWGEVVDDAGRSAAAGQHTPDGYNLTVQSSLAAVAGVLSGTVPPPGYHTPATAFGPDFVLGLPGVTRADV